METKIKIVEALARGEASLSDRELQRDLIDIYFDIKDVRDRISKHKGQNSKLFKEAVMELNSHKRELNALLERI